jgi:hypothetical protein
MTDNTDTITLNAQQIRALDVLLEYVEENERRDYLECNEYLQSGHIYRSVLVLKALREASAA